MLIEWGLGSINMALLTEGELDWVGVINMALLTEGELVGVGVYEHGPPDGGRIGRDWGL